MTSFQPNKLKYIETENNFCFVHIEPGEQPDMAAARWDINYSMSIDINCSLYYDELCCYIVAHLYDKANTELVSINTITSYHTSKLKLEETDPKLLKYIITKAIGFTQEIFEKETAGTKFLHISFTQPDEKLLDMFVVKRLKQAVSERNQYIDAHVPASITADNLVMKLTNIVTELIMINSKLEALLDKDHCTLKELQDIELQMNDSLRELPGILPAMVKYKPDPAVIGTKLKDSITLQTSALNKLVILRRRLGSK